MFLIKAQRIPTHAGGRSDLANFQHGTPLTLELTPAFRLRAPITERGRITMLSESRYLQIVRASAWYDLAVTAAFATPWTFASVGGLADEPAAGLARQRAGV